MQNLFEILLLSKISGCVLIFLEKKSSLFFGNLLYRYIPRISNLQVGLFYQTPHFNHRIKSRILWHIWKASNFLNTTVSFIEYRKTVIGEEPEKLLCEEGS